MAQVLVPGSFARVSAIGMGLATSVDMLGRSVRWFGMFAISLAGLAGCEGAVAESDGVVRERGLPTDVLTQRTPSEAEAEADAHASAGWIAIESSLVVPFCPAVALSSHEVLAPRSCVEGVPLSQASFGTNIPGRGATVAIRDATPLDDTFALVSLAEPTPSSESVLLKNDVYDVEVRSFAYVAAGDESWSWTWSGTLEVDGGETSLSPHRREDMQNCHGDVGAGVFLPSGELVGVISGVAQASECADLLNVELIVDAVPVA